MYYRQLALVVAATVEAQFAQLVGAGIAKRNALWFTTGLIITDGQESYYNEILGLSFGDEEVAREYEPFATGKAELTARERTPSGTVIDLYPDRLLPGDVCYRGGYVLPNSRIVCAASGIQSRLDESLSAGGCATAVAVIGLATDQARGLRFDQVDGFFPESTVRGYMAVQHTA